VTRSSASVAFHPQLRRRGAAREALEQILAAGLAAPYAAAMGAGAALDRRFFVLPRGSAALSAAAAAIQASRDGGPRRRRAAGAAARQARARR